MTAKPRAEESRQPLPGKSIPRNFFVREKNLLYK